MEFAVSRGASTWALAERSGIDLVTLQNNDNRVPFASYVALMRAGQDLCKDPALALHFGEHVDPSELTFTSQLGGPELTMDQCIALMNHYSALTVEVDSDGDRLGLERRGGQMWIIDRRKNPNDFPELTESMFARVASTGRRMFAAKSFVREIHVTHSAPSYSAEYDRIFKAPVFFDSNKNAIVMPDDGFMIRRPPPASREALERLSVHAESMLQDLEDSKSTRARVESLLTPVLKSGEVNMETIARKLSVSRQTLFRKLKAEGVTFEEVLDELRHKLALDYIKDKRRPLKEISYLLGFSDPAAFSRAFKRWTGTSPRSRR
ncbi:MAG TPA: AraC family transcriptional regulator ligand-binding domain-containing protein [Gemmatimonadaceae bacterium]|nr:AraC family transcriptional regulator ligand-binding domain-containing protein [Gemmatimonadaceae bacterium]